MTNGCGADMASFMTKKKKYKFQVDICLEELLEVPFVSAVLFAKLRLLDGGSFQDTSSREEVRDHTVKWGAKFSFPCKMMANASTGVLERCVLRISVRKECKGGRSFNKLGFVDLNLAEFAGAGVTSKKALLEGYDARHRQDNSMLRFSIKMNMLSGDILFKVPSPSLKHKTINADEQASEPRPEEFSSGSLAGSIASGSSGFGSLTKKRPALLSSELVTGHTLAENCLPSDLPTETTTVTDTLQPPLQQHEEAPNEHGHSRNSSNTSQLSKASGYSSIHSHSHSRQSSSGDSGHIRMPQRSLMTSLSNSTIPRMSFPLMRINTFPSRFLNAHNTSSPEDVYGTPNGDVMFEPNFNKTTKTNLDKSEYHTPKGYNSQISNTSSSSTEEYKTPDSSLTKKELFPPNFVELRKSCSSSVVDQRVKSMSTIKEHVANHLSDSSEESSEDKKSNSDDHLTNGVLRSKSDYELLPDLRKNDSKAYSLWAFLTPHLKRKNSDVGKQSTPNASNPSNSLFKVPSSPIHKRSLRSLPETSTSSLNSLKSAGDTQQLGVKLAQRSLPHRKLLDNTTGGKLTPVAISPDDILTTLPSDCTQIVSTVRHTSVTTNPSSSSLVLSETGSLDRAKAALERRKKAQAQDSDVVPGRVEVTRVNPDELIADLLKNTNLEPVDDSGEASGLQLFIAKDGTAAVGNHEVKSQMSTGVQVFKQVVMDDNR